MLQLWAADPHQFGPGKVHALDPERDGQTYCGKLTAAFPGKPVSSGKVTCKICCDAPARRQESAERWRRYEEERLARERQQEQERREYRDRYHAYLQTPAWREKSAAVIKRADGWCEGCGVNRATQAHHLTYDHVGDEFLWELRAVCRRCHERFHSIAAH